MGKTESQRDAPVHYACETRDSAGNKIHNLSVVTPYLSVVLEQLKLAAQMYEADRIFEEMTGDNPVIAYPLSFTVEFQTHVGATPKAEEDDSQISAGDQARASRGHRRKEKPTDSV